MDKKIILYGDGKLGNRTREMLMKMGLPVYAITDSNEQKVKNRIAETKDGITIQELKSNNEEYIVIVTIGNLEERKKVEEKLKSYKIDVVLEENILEKILDGDKVGMNRMVIADAHRETAYYEQAEKTDALCTFWNKDSIFYQMFQTLDLNCVVELACGHGRHVPLYAQNAAKVILVDILNENIEICKNRFHGLYNHITYYENNGQDLSKISDGTCTALFTYDAMVHFELIDIFQYLKESYRILKPKGRALFHHSNNTASYKVTYKTGEHRRNYMSKDIFAHLADRSGFTVIQQEVIDWGRKGNALDCVTLLEK